MLLLTSVPKQSAVILGKSYHCQRTSDLGPAEQNYPARDALRSIDATLVIAH